MGIRIFQRVLCLLHLDCRINEYYVYQYIRSLDPCDINIFPNCRYLYFVAQDCILVLLPNYLTLLIDLYL